MDNTPFWLSPLNEQLQQHQNAENAEIFVSEHPRFCYLILRGKSDEFIQAVEKTLKLTLPTNPRSTGKRADIQIWWLSPDEWAILAPAAQKIALMNTLHQGLAATSYQLVDNSGGMTALELTGKSATLLLRHLTPYDAEKMQENEVISTIAGQSTLLIYRHSSGYTLIIRRSFADYLWKRIVKAARPYGLAVEK